MKPTTLITWGMGLGLLACSAPMMAQGYRLIEAEDCAITCARGMAEDGNMWASGGRRAPAFWGEAVGDSVSFSYRFGSPVEGLKIALRCAYNRQAAIDHTHHENPDRMLDLLMDGQRVAEVHVPDTGSWDLFRTTTVELPSIPAGEHVFALVASAPFTYTDFDCFILFRGEEENLPAALRNTILADSPTGHFSLRATAGVRLQFNPDAILGDFERIYDHYHAHMSWEPPNPVTVNILADDVWPDPGATAFQNQWGVFFRESTFLTDRGNWLHEMTHMFYCAHFPWWFDESSVRTLTTFDWAPTLFPQHARPEDNPYYRQCWEEGMAILNDPTRRSDPAEPIQYAVRIRYGPEVFSRFFHLCAEAGERGEIDFTPGRHLTRDEIVHFMSLAAEEDVRPLYERWNGFAGAE